MAIFEKDEIGLVQLTPSDKDGWVLMGSANGNIRETHFHQLQTDNKKRLCATEREKIRRIATPGVCPQCGSKITPEALRQCECNACGYSYSDAIRDYGVQYARKISSRTH